MFFKPVIIFLFFLLFYIGTSRIYVLTDTVVATYLPVSLIRGNGFNVEKTFPAINKILPQNPNMSDPPYYVIHENNRYFSAFPVFSSLLATPIYFIPVILKGITLENLNLDENITLVLSLGKISAAFFAAVSTVFVYLSAKQFLKKEKALLLTLLYALGTSTLSISSQSLWQHGASQMFLAITIYFFILGQKKKHLLPATGLFLGFATIARFANVFITLIFLVYFLIFERKSAFKFLLLTLPAIFFFVWYQITYPGNIFFYKYEAWGEIAKLNSSYLAGFLGLLIAPSKGLFVYSPIFLFSLLGSLLTFRKKIKAMRFFSVLVGLYVLSIASWSDWHGGWSYGPRMLADITPFLILLLAPVIKINKMWQNKIFKATFFLVAFFSIFVHFLGSTVADFSWYQIQTRFLPVEESHKATFLWDWKYPEIYSFYLGAGGFFGTVYVFSIEIINIALTMIKGFAIFGIIFTIYLIFKRICKNLAPQITKFL
ncbi:hypothetical protein A3D07_03055 [Candidatus Curtissbacteria bacterium RIFCSPHIGHO2_02_FULL_42_15]|uniref:Glycosyltransferase RgtA/B/C/D-like domain-containing protein n=1 Tax=Candidatus Curtissbacteria bacterium RIFCSPHIGHO2_02_FULL_42_15 TaxID=1797716 RepID=A0A1F5GJQ2_9BACT|nr:MAG: hypothetical protein A3D07_03055 [Candidatus Curtissbacteria bacterium RIFCSPHIGHO2_02_FULL_42_15]